MLRWLLERTFSVDLLRQFNELRVAIEPGGGARRCTPTIPSARAIAAGLERMKAAEEGRDDTLDADIAFHVSVLRASGNPFYSQFRDVVSTALRTSIRFTNRFKGHSASVPEHEAVKDAIFAHDPDEARRAMRRIIDDVLDLIGEAERGKGAGLVP